MRRFNLVSRWFFAALVLVALVWVGDKLLPDPRPDERPEHVVGTLAECPVSSHWSDLFLVAYRFQPGSIGQTGEISIAGRQTDIPEFNDCQKFITPDPADQRFISLFAIFASSSLDSVARASAPLPDGRPVAVIFAYDSAYAPLSIQPGFNCVHFFGPASGVGEISATIVSVGNNESECAQVRPPNEGAKLRVTKHRQANASPDDYPPVARWDWDSTTRTQFFGIKCGDAWCEVGGATASAPSSRSYRNQYGAFAAARVIEVKGWYDEQQLAVPGQNGLAVGQVRGTLIPEPDLGTHDMSDYSGRWTYVARIGIEGDPGVYAQKLNLSASPPETAANRLALCYSGANSANCFGSTGTTPPTCKPGVTPGWWGRIESARGVVRFFCVVRRDHSAAGVRIPGVARWRWLLADETIWIRCLEGCCEVQAG